MPTRTEFDTVGNARGDGGAHASRAISHTQPSSPGRRFSRADSRRLIARKGRRLLAPIVKCGQPGRAVSREAVTTKFYDVPEIKPIRVSTVADLDQRVLGENAYTRRSAEERLAEIIAKDLADLTDSIVRRIEKMASAICC